MVPSDCLQRNLITVGGVVGCPLKRKIGMNMEEVGGFRGLTNEQTCCPLPKTLSLTHSFSSISWPFSTSWTRCIHLKSLHNLSGVFSQDLLLDYGSLQVLLLSRHVTRFSLLLNNSFTLPFSPLLFMRVKEREKPSWCTCLICCGWLVFGSSAHFVSLSPWHQTTDFHLSKSMSLKRCLSERQTKRRKDVKVMEERSIKY